MQQQQQQQQRLINCCSSLAWTGVATQGGVAEVKSQSCQRLRSRGRGGQAGRGHIEQSAAKSHKTFAGCLCFFFFFFMLQVSLSCIFSILLLPLHSSNIHSSNKSSATPLTQCSPLLFINIYDCPEPDDDRHDDRPDDDDAAAGPRAVSGCHRQRLATIVAAAAAAVCVAGVAAAAVVAAAAARSRSRRQHFFMRHFLHHFYGQQLLKSLYDSNYPAATVAD